jgi:uncharacterized protein DUF3644
MFSKQTKADQTLLPIVTGDREPRIGQPVTPELLGPRPRGYLHSLRASKDEVVLAVDLYNRVGQRRSLEAFVVHMHIGWLYLLHAEMLREGKDIRYWDSIGTQKRLVRVAGEPKTWDLQRCVEEKWPASSPVRQNIQFFIGLRNKIEHRHEAATAVLIAGLAQAHILNYEEELTNAFGARESLADTLRFPLFLTSLTDTGINALKRLNARVPRRTARYFDSFYGQLDSSVTQDNRFEFRVHLIPQLGPRTRADLAVNFVRLEDLSDQAKGELSQLGQTATVIVRKAERPVQNLGRLRPRDVVSGVRKQWPAFNMGTFVHSWQMWKVRPDSKSQDPADTDQRYCVYDQPHRDYVYTDAYVQRILKHQNELEL